MLPNGHSSTIERPVITAKILLNKLYLKIVIALDKIVSFRFNKIFPCSMLLNELLSYYQNFLMSLHSALLLHHR
ncbi:hypothetical protein OZD67_03725 [Wolbachia endosymbiont of Drosophila nikananu]|uniref:hypothetical protein n=1 Tax=Wolbachia endosymbiont of Drosophila nikananu TaxID=375550 RepID=UPI0023AA1426|nr:hypothetical protein [Wolbachia endosymbiont of Drosophila nikananu]MDE5061218.1 hypothetical protein [Wolbachia endosymbiont of Drosophila nikananu]